jgi:hypothetical protein
MEQVIVPSVTTIHVKSPLWTQIVFVLRGGGESTYGQYELLLENNFSSIPFAQY